MPRTKSAEIVADGTPVMHTPRGASPRGLRSDTFVSRPPGPPPVTVPGPEESEERAPDPPPGDKPASTGPRDWDFAVPEPSPERTRDPLIDPDVNWRQHAGLRAPVDPAPLPELARERFSENWQRLAAEPLRDRRSHAQRRMEKSGLTRWMFSHGRFEMGAAFGFLLLMALLVAAFVYGRRLLAGQDQKANRPAEAHPASTR